MPRSAVMDQERRDLPQQIVLRVDDQVVGERFYGHAAVFDSRTAIGNPLKWGFYEEIKSGAFSKTLGESDPRMLIDHNPSFVVSRVSAGTLLLFQDKEGLAVDSALDTELSYVADLKANLRNKNITGMSFGFMVVKDEWKTEKVSTNDGNDAEVEVRIIHEVKLIEVSAVTFPAYEATDAGLRAALRCRGDVEAIRARLDFRPELATLLDEPWARASDPKKPYGNVKYADPGYQKDGKKRYPIDSKEHCLAAWSYINQSKNASKYTSAQLKSIKSRIKAALKKYGVDVDESKSMSYDELVGELVGARGVTPTPDSDEPFAVEPDESDEFDEDDVDDEPASTVDGDGDVVVESAPESTVDTEEPAETTPRSQDDTANDEATEPAETTRHVPSDAELAAARLRVLHAQLRHLAA